MINRPPAARSERGQATLEYVAAIAIAALLVITVAVAGWGGQLSELAGRTICPLLQPTTCEVDSGPTPYDRAVKGRYVAMGDSFASGEGAQDYEEGSNYEDGSPFDPRDNEEGNHNRCRRSANAYSRILSANNEFAGGSKFVACSGAVMDDFEHPNRNHTGEDPQLAALGDDVSLVTLSIGGNDLGFAPVVSECTENRLLEREASCREKYEHQVIKRIPEIRQQLVERYRQIRQKAKHARVIVVGYPPLFLDDPSDRRTLPAVEDQRWINTQAHAFNAAIASAAEEAGVEFVDPTDAFRGHNLGAEDSWFNGIIAPGPGPSKINPGTFHPNPRGQAAFAALIQRQLEYPR